MNFTDLPDGLGERMFELTVPTVENLEAIIADCLLYSDFMFERAERGFFLKYRLGSLGTLQLSRRGTMTILRFSNVPPGNYDELLNVNMLSALTEFNNLKKTYRKTATAQFIANLKNHPAWQQT